MNKTVLINKKGLPYFILFFTVFVFFCIVQPGRQISLAEFGWLFMRVLISGFLLFVIFLKNKYAFSLANVLYIFFLTFFMLAPVGQYFSSVVFWSANKANHNLLGYFIADICIVFFLIFFYIGNNIKINFFNRVTIVNKNLTSPKSFYFILTLIHLLIFLWIMNDIGFPEMLFRFTNNIEEDDNTTLGLIISKYVKALSIVSMLYLLNDKESKVSGRSIIIFINLILFFLIFFPTSAARFQIIGVYLGLFVLVFQKKFSKQSVSLLFLLGLFIVFPFLEVFRNVSSFDEFNFSDVGKSISSAFNEGHYDSYQMLVNSINFVDVYGVAWGKQLLGALLFFIPRSLWLGKPSGSGAYIAENMSFSFTNVSMPIIGEGYVNFGFIGVIFFGLVFGVLCQFFDKKFWIKNKYNDNSLFMLFYPIFLGYFFFMNRGDLLSSFAFLVGLYLAFVTINFITKPFVQYNKKQGGI